jgi:hypothetical protein
MMFAVLTGACAGCCCCSIPECVRARNTSTAGYCALQLLRAARQLPRSSREQMPVVFIRRARAHKTLFN